jgi:hypothetical protein
VLQDLLHVLLVDVHQVHLQLLQLCLGCKQEYKNDVSDALYARKKKNEMEKTRRDEKRKQSQPKKKKSKSQDKHWGHPTIACVYGPRKLAISMCTRSRRLATKQATLA